MAEEEGARQQQLQKALQLALRLEEALSACKANVVRHHARILNEDCLQRRVITLWMHTACKAGKQESILPFTTIARTSCQPLIVDLRAS